MQDLDAIIEKAQEHINLAILQLQGYPIAFADVISALNDQLQEIEDAREEENP